MVMALTLSFSWPTDNCQQRINASELLEYREEMSPLCYFHKWYMCVEFQNIQPHDRV